MKRWDLIAVMERQQREYEALAIKPVPPCSRPSESTSPERS
jgi:hypothetical protein